MFNNTVKVEWLEGDAREMLLLTAVVFVDENRVPWIAPAGSLIDGASIPRFFWRVIGSPFIGRFRRASVIHDVYCKTKSVPHEVVHKMFYEAMLCDGVPKFKAKAMYYAVFFGGPKW